MTIAACDDTTDNIGSSITNDVDNISIKDQVFNVTSRSIVSGPVLSRNNTGMIGMVKDPETGTYVAGDYIKTAYAEEPSFANSKVIISLYTNELKGELGTHFKRCVEFRDAKSELLSDYKEDFDFIELGKMAIDYSDGVIEGESMANRTLLDYANEKSKPTLAYPGDDFADAYKTFINEVCPDEE